MKRIGLKVFTMCTVFLLFFVSLPAANAASADLKITTSSETVFVGDTFTVTVTFTSSSAIGTLQAALKYDADKMEYLSGGGNAVELSNGSGGILYNGSGTEKVMSFSLRFRALKAGKANFSVTSSDITSFEGGADLGSPTSKTSITINDKSGVGNEAKDFIEITLDGKKLYILSDLSNVELPDGFKAEEILYNAASVDAANNPASGLTLLYLMDETSAGNFYIYDLKTNAFSPYLSVTIDSSYIILPLKSGFAGYSLSSAVINGLTVPACISNTNPDFILLYAINSLGDAGYYFYDKTDGTMQRVLLDTAVLTLNAEKNVTGIIYIMAAVCILLAGVAIWLRINIKNKRVRKIVFNKNKF